MKLTEKFTAYLKEYFSEVFVYDERGDGHFVQMIVISPDFEGKNLVQRSRYIFQILGDFTKIIHAYSVKGFTPEEWKEKKDDLELIKYTHYK